VGFTLTAPANGIVVRFSIPDSADGNGLNGAIGVSVNGGSPMSLPVTSHFSWVYGNYPFTKNPRDGQAHHFFDETSGLFSSEVSSGSKVRITPMSGNFNVTIDLVDFYTVPAPYPQPTGYVSITDHGADPSGKKDSTQAIQNTISDAQSKKTGVWIPEGRFIVNTRFTIPSNMNIKGAGPWYSFIVATSPSGVGFFGNGAPNPSVNVGLYDFSIRGDTNVRVDSNIDSGCGGSLQNSLIQNLWIEHVKVGMWFDGPASGLHVVGTTIRNTYADGVNLHKGIANTILEQSMIRNTGDDGLAMWSDATSDDTNTFRFNTVQLPLLANCIGIYGGKDNSATDNYVADTVYSGGGLQASNRFGSVALSGTTTFARNTVVRCGAVNSYNGHNGAFWFWSDDGPMTGSVNVQDTSITDSSFSGVSFWGSQIINMSWKNVTVSGAPYAIVVNNGLSGSASFTDVTAHNLSMGGVYSCNPNFKLIAISGDSGWSDVHC